MMKAVDGWELYNVAGFGFAYCDDRLASPDLMTGAFAKDGNSPDRTT